MREVTIVKRLKCYTRELAYYILGVGISWIISLVIIFQNPVLGVLFALLFWVLFFYRLHFCISAILIENVSRKRILLMLPIVFLSTGLLCLKIYVNESIQPGMHPVISENKRILNYFLYSSWMPVVLWELYYIILLWFNKNSNAQALSRL